MANEHGEWIMYGVSENDPCCIKSTDKLLEYINKVGFLPLFKNEIPGFSVEEHTVSRYWWSGNAERDPWEWRGILARSGKVAYGKFFDKKAGFVSLEMLPYFCNYRRDGYDFDARWDDEKATARQKKIMDLFMNGEALFSFEAKLLAGFGKGGEKNFEGVVTSLEMQSYLCVKDFRCRTNKYGEAYGWQIAIYSAPEAIWGYDLISGAYNEEPGQSLERIISKVGENFAASREDILKIIK